MEIRFSNKDIESLCTDKARAVREIGTESAAKLFRRIGEISAAWSVGELVAGRPHPLKGDKVGKFSLDLHKGDRLVFMPAENPPPKKPDGSIEWQEVKEVIIIHVVDYHD